MGTRRLPGEKSEACGSRGRERSRGSSLQLHGLQADRMLEWQASAGNQATMDLMQRKPSGLPDNLKSGIESLSGISMDDARVHRDSAKPAQLNAHAYAQGSDIHVASGQERHLPHEAWHVVQQSEGRDKSDR